MDDIVVEICGSAGEGTISAGEILSRHMSSEGYNIMSFDTYPPEIRGFGKCVAHNRISTTNVMTPGRLADVLIALNDVHSISQLPLLKDAGVLIYDSQPISYHEEDKSIAGWIEPGIISYGIPMVRLAVKAAGNSRGKNMVALGAFSALFGVDDKLFIKSIEKRYARKKKIVIESNVNSFKEGYNWTLENITKLDTYKMNPAPKKDKEQLIINGNQAVAEAAYLNGLHFYAGYPITPATKIMEILSSKLPENGGVFVQTEDEISAIAMVVGAGFAGKRAMTATSGPGFCLMSEFTGLSVMAEIPAVIINSQRGGPSTGLPTKTEQSDLFIALHGGSGDSPRVVIAPSSTEECYQATIKALHIAEKYQTLVIVLLDFFLSNSVKNIDAPEPDDNGSHDSNIAPDLTDLSEYRRYKVTESGLSPRAIPGTPEGMYTSTGLEHGENGKPMTDPDTHVKMTAKRFRKHRSILAEAPEPVISGYDDTIDVGVLSWGSSAGAAHEAVALANANGYRSAAFSSMFISPFPEEALRSFTEKCTKVVIAEVNESGQFCDYICKYLTKPFEKLTTVNCNPMSSDEIFNRIKDIS